MHDELKKEARDFYDDWRKEPNAAERRRRTFERFGRFGRGGPSRNSGKDDCGNDVAAVAPSAGTGKLGATLGASGLSGGKVGRLPPSFQGHAQGSGTLVNGASATSSMALVLHSSVVPVVDAGMDDDLDALDDAERNEEVDEKVTKAMVFCENWRTTFNEAERGNA